MGIYDINKTLLNSAYSINSDSLDVAYDLSGNVVFEQGYQLRQEYKGGYIEIQPDSWDGSTPVNGTIVSASDPTAWGFPMSLSSATKSFIKSDILNGNGYGIKYIRFPLGFAYRGYRNIDSNTGLARNIGERWTGQNDALKAWFSNIADAGGGLAPEYWCLAPHWLTGGAYYSPSGNKVWAGGSYSRSTTLASIRTSDPTQYNNQIDELTDAIVNDYEYLHQNIAPVKMFGLSNEPNYGSQKYGACEWEAQTYNDVLTVLYQKIKESNILPSDIMLHVASDDSDYFTSQGAVYIANHSDTIWGYSYHGMRYASGEVGDGADSFYKSSTFADIKGDKNNVFINEYEYFSTTSRTDEFRCSNNMVHLIDEMVYGGAEVLHPIIHICKPTGQTSSQTNTTGYCLYAIDMTDGSYSLNTWAYNSWKMFNDNLPIGSRVVANYFVNVSDVGFMATYYDDSLRLFMANSSGSEKTFTINFGNQKSFIGKLYNLSNLGTSVSNASGQSITFTIPAHSGLVYIEQS